MKHSHGGFPISALFKPLRRKRKAYNCWSFFICENALPCNDMMALSLRSLKTIKSNNYGHCMPSGKAGAPTAHSIHLTNTLCTESTNGVTPKEPIRRPGLKNRIFVPEAGCVTVSEIHFMLLHTAYLTHKGPSRSAVLCYWISHYLN